MNAKDLVRPGVPRLSPKERAILELLCKYPGESFSTQGILDAVWGPNWIGELSTVAVHISWLRAKIAPHEIRSERKRGYRLVIKEAA